MTTLAIIAIPFVAVSIKLAAEYLTSQFGVALTLMAMICINLMVLAW